MNDLFFRLRCAGLALGLASLLGNSGAWAQTNIPRQADFIVAVVNSEPITNQEVQLEVKRVALQLAQQASWLSGDFSLSLALPAAASASSAARTTLSASAFSSSSC